MHKIYNKDDKIHQAVWNNSHCKLKVNINVLKCHTPQEKMEDTIKG